MLAEQRKNRILELLSREFIVKVADLSNELGATEATIRRDLDELQDKKMVRRIHGGATLSTPASKPLNRTELMVICQMEKQRIAQKAIGFIRENDAVLLDSSTTVFELARLIAENPPGNITVITNSFVMVPLFAGSKGVKVIHTGGDIAYEMEYSTGVITRNMLTDIRVDKCFLGANGIDAQFGYSVPTLADAEVKRAMITAAKQAFVLADHTKIGECYMGRFADFSGQIDYLITDHLPQNADIRQYRASVELIEADSSDEKYIVNDL